MADEKVGVHPGGGELMTKQADALDSDVNVIMSRWIQHGTPLPENGSRPEYGDFTNVDDYLSALMRVRAMEQDFSALPAAVRDWCANDPARFVELVYKEDQQAKLIELGLAKERIPAPAVKVEVVNPVAPAASGEEPAK